MSKIRRSTTNASHIHPGVLRVKLVMSLRALYASQMTVRPGLQGWLYQLMVGFWQGETPLALGHITKVDIELQHTMNDGAMMGSWKLYASNLSACSPNRSEICAPAEDR